VTDPLASRTDPDRSSETVVPRTTALGERSPTAETAVLVVGFFLVQYPLSVVGLVGLFALSPAVVLEPWTLVTSTYAHGGPGHLLGNLLGLVLFGALVERVSSRLRFHAFFVVTGALAGLAEITLGSLFSLQFRAVLGASGAVFGLLGYLLAGNELSDRLLGAVGRASGSRWARVAVLVGVAAVLALALSAPGTALVGHAAGLLVGLVAGRFRLLHVRRGG
jgi:membrane associated rhomboid family serine protease